MFCIIISFNFIVLQGKIIPFLQIRKVTKAVYDTLKEISDENTCVYSDIPSSFRAVPIVNIVHHVNSNSVLFLGRQCFRAAFDMTGIKAVRLKFSALHPYSGIGA